MATAGQRLPCAGGRPPAPPTVEDLLPGLGSSWRAVDGSKDWGWGSEGISGSLSSRHLMDYMNPNPKARPCGEQDQ